MYIYIYIYIYIYTYIHIYLYIPLFVYCCAKTTTIWQIPLFVYCCAKTHHRSREWWANSPICLPLCVEDYPGAVALVPSLGILFLFCFFAPNKTLLFPGWLDQPPWKHVSRVAGSATLEFACCFQGGWISHPGNTMFPGWLDQPPWKHHERQCFQGGWISHPGNTIRVMLDD